MIKSMRSEYGTYACWGNHDVPEEILAGFTWNDPDQNRDDPRMKEWLESAGVTLLEDESAVLPNGVLLYGRKDPSRSKKLRESRQSPEELMWVLDETKPVIVIDHQPKELAGVGADVDLSGHTHDNQEFPGNLILKLMWENSCGYMKIGEMHFVVTSGA